MDSDLLVSDDIRRGLRVIRRLKKGGVSLKGAFWRHESEPERWRLVLAAPEADDDSRDLLLEAAHLLDVDDMLSIEFVNPGDAVFRAMEQAAGAKVPHGKRVRSSIVGGRYIDDAFVYTV